MRLKCKNLSQNFNQKVLFNNLSFDIECGDFAIIYGRSGCGKTTLLNLISGLLKPSYGNISVYDNEQKIDIYTSNFRQNHLNYVFQNFALLENETVKKNLLLPLLGEKISNDEKNKRIMNSLERVGLKNTLNEKVAILSGGEQQRVALARTLLKKGNLILADEPTGNLDYKNKMIVLDFLYELHKEGKTVIIVTHDDTFREYATKIIEL